MRRLADHECRHGRLAFDHTAPCGCWPEEGAVVRALPQARARSKRTQSQPVTALPNAPARARFSS